METKKHIRRRILEIREAVSQIECSKNSRIILQKILTDVHYQEASYLLTYLDFGKEVETSQLVEQAWIDGKEVYCPRVIGDKMIFLKISTFSEVNLGYMGIREPSGLEKNAFVPRKEILSRTLCIMPGVAFDRQKHRIGYGKGYYDRFLLGKDSLMTIALCFDYQLLDEIPSEEFDLKPKIIYTETQKL